MITLKVTKNRGFTFSLKHTFLEKLHWGQIDTPAFFGLIKLIRSMLCMVNNATNSLSTKGLSRQEINNKMRDSFQRPRTKLF